MDYAEEAREDWMDYYDDRHWNGYHYDKDNRPKGMVLTANAPPKILMYSHDTFGLGHIRRCLAIALSLRKSPANILILTGSPIVGRFKIPRRIDFVRIPGMIKVTNEQYLPLSMKLDATEVLEIRKGIIQATAKAFRPDFFIVDKAPLGLKREVVETLHWIKSDLPHCTSILGLRDIMDNAASTIEDWQSKGIYEAMDQLYDEVWVYGCQDFFDPIAEYEIPARVASRVVFTGYIPRKVPTEAQIESTRKALGIGQNEKLIVMTIGGGGDGHPVVKAFLAAFHPSQGGIPPGTKVVCVTGPFISDKNYESIRRNCESFGFMTVKFYRFMERLIGAAQVVVSMGGYNTVCEIVSQRKPFLIIPRAVPREEQLIRAKVFSSKGFCNYIDPRNLCPDEIRAKVLELLNNGSEFRERMASFHFTGLDVIREHLSRSQARRKREARDRGARPGMIPLV